MCMQHRLAALVFLCNDHARSFAVHYECLLNVVQAGRINGWAMETRVYAENPLRGFIPSPGQLSVYREPVGANVR